MNSRVEMNKWRKQDTKSRRKLLNGTMSFSTLPLLQRQRISKIHKATINAFRGDSCFLRVCLFFVNSCLILQYTILWLQFIILLWKCEINKRVKSVYKVRGFRAKTILQRKGFQPHSYVDVRGGFRVGEGWLWLETQAIIVPNGSILTNLKLMKLQYNKLSLLLMWLGRLSKVFAYL